MAGKAILFLDKHHRAFVKEHHYMDDLDIATALRKAFPSMVIRKGQLMRQIAVIKQEASIGKRVDPFKEMHQNLLTEFGARLSWRVEKIRGVKHVTYFVDGVKAPLVDNGRVTPIQEALMRIKRGAKE